MTDVVPERAWVVLKRRQVDLLIDPEGRMSLPPGVQMRMPRWIWVQFPGGEPFQMRVNFIRDRAGEGL